MQSKMRNEKRGRKRGCIEIDKCKAQEEATSNSPSCAHSLKLPLHHVERVPSRKAESCFTHFDLRAQMVIFGVTLKLKTSQPHHCHKICNKTAKASGQSQHQASHWTKHHSQLSSQKVTKQLSSWALLSSLSILKKSYLSSQKKTKAPKRQDQGHLLGLRLPWPVVPQSQLGRHVFGLLGLCLRTFWSDRISKKNRVYNIIT